MLTKRQEEAIAYLPAVFRDMASAVFRGTASAGSAAYIRTHCLICKQGSTAEVKDCAEELCALRHRRPFRIHNSKTTGEIQQ
jgi:hypothetical protein